MEIAATYKNAPFTANNEGRGKLFSWMAGCIATAGLLMPWAGAAYLAHARSIPLAAALARTGELPPFRLACMDFMVLCLMSVFASILRDLGRQIAKGGDDAESLDSFRSRIASGCMAGALILLIAVTPH